MWSQFVLCRWWDVCAMNLESPKEPLEGSNLLWYFFPTIPTDIGWPPLSPWRGNFHKGWNPSYSNTWTWVFPKIMVPPNHPLFSPSILGYNYFWKHPCWGDFLLWYRRFWGKSPLNYHLGGHVLPFPSILSKSKNIIPTLLGENLMIINAGNYSEWSFARMSQEVRITYNNSRN